MIRVILRFMSHMLDLHVYTFSQVRRYLLDFEIFKCFLLLLVKKMFSRKMQSIKVLNSHILSFLSSQCLQSSENCDSFGVDKILAMMMNTKTSTKPLVVVNGSVQPEITG